MLLSKHIKYKNIFRACVIRKENTPVSRVTVFGFMNPVFGVLLSALVLGETAQAFSVNSLVLTLYTIEIVYHKNIINRHKSLI